ncbi:MAG: CRISPR-associated endoribonuclease Cas6 [Bacteroidales bacterium]|nr:CRISPR-associated endoribonuclease Cas6 [Bacteroidales bacterium]MCF8328340.1 CRISPR-associated endoribonuclease Cas6 [Bacteroidales bacterium]
MRFKLTLTRTSKQRMLPMEYMYYISAWIYKVIGKADKEFAQFLHDKGYGASDTKLYKLFCFSPLNFGKPKLWKEKKLFEIKNHEISLQLAFDVQEAASHFIQGLFLEQEFYLGDKFNGIDFKVTKVEALPEPEFTETMHYRLKTPWIVSYKVEGSNVPKYLKPGDDHFYEQSVRHIAEKYKNIRGEEIPANEIDFKPGEDYKRAGYVIKPNTPEQTRVVGNLFDFELTAPVKTHRMIWNAGVSEKSSIGFGWCEKKEIDGD